MSSNDGCVALDAGRRPCVQVLLPVDGTVNWKIEINRGD